MRVRLLFIIVAFLFSMNAAQAQTALPAADRTAERARVERLTALAKLWGQVKFFHPYPAYREIDWDKALIEAIPRVNAARTPQEFEAAINSMLAGLGDRQTRARVAAPNNRAPAQTPPAAAQEPVRLENGLLIVDAPAVARVISEANDRLPEFLGKTGELFPQAKAVLLDLRAAAKAEESAAYELGLFLNSALPAMLDHDVSLATVRYRLHNGYTPQIGATSGGYYSGMTTEAPVTMAARGRAKTPPFVILVNDNSDQMHVVSGLQAARLAYVIQESEADPADEPGVVKTKLELPDGVEVEMRIAELINPDGTVGFVPDLIAPRGAIIERARRLIAENNFVSNRRPAASVSAPLLSQKDKPYAEMEFPSAEYRLLALFRFWNVINYFFPYKDLTGVDWNEILPRYIPRFEANKNAVDYQMTMRELAAETRDSHVRVENTRASDEKIGMFVPPVLLRFVENQTVVVKVLDDKLPVKPGDVILAIDGEPIEQRRETLARIFPASTPQGSMLSVHASLLRGSKESLAKLKVRGVDGRTREVEIARSLPRQDRKLFEAAQRTTQKFAVMPNGFAYVDLDRLTVGEIDRMFTTIKAAPAVIFDMRGYPNGTAWEIAPRLTSVKTPVGALFSRPILEGTNFYRGQMRSTDYFFKEKIPEAKGDLYAGKIVVLINEDAISQAEYTCMFFKEARPDTIFIGTPTRGANGDVTRMILPGNLSVPFTGHNVRHADGRQLQRVGIQPDVRVQPTIEGIAAGRDEVLEAAIRYLQSANSRP